MRINLPESLIEHEHEREREREHEREIALERMRMTSRRRKREHEREREHERDREREWSLSASVVRACAQRSYETRKFPFPLNIACSVNDCAVQCALSIRLRDWHESAN